MRRRQFLIASATLFAQVPAHAENDAPYALAVLRDFDDRVTSLAAQARDGSLLISIVHRGTSGPVDLEIVMKDFASTAEVEIQTLSADVPWATNTLEKPEAIIPISTAGKIENGKLLITVKPYTVLRITAAR